MNDNWGKKETIKMIVDTAKSWYETKNDYFSVGDISKYTGGTFFPHSTHKDGTGVDLKSRRTYYTSAGPNNEYADIRCSDFNKSEALEFCKKLVAGGAKTILFNCKYVIDRCDEVIACASHHHHLHVESDVMTLSSNQDSYRCKYCNSDVYSRCGDSFKIQNLSGNDLTS